VIAMQTLLICSWLLAKTTGLTPRCRRAARIFRGGGVGNATDDAAATAALEERVATSTPQAPYDPFSTAAAMLADGCADLAALAARLEPTYRLHVAVLRARAAKAFSDALDADASPEQIAEDAVAAEFAFAEAVESATPAAFQEVWTRDDAVEAFRDVVAATVEDALASQSLEGWDDGDIPSRRDRVLDFCRAHKRFIFRGGALLLNVVQGRIATRQARRAAEKRDCEQPKIPLF